jgi:hypothetical protein
MRHVLTDHGISLRCAPRRKAIEELTDAEFETMLDGCTYKQAYGRPDRSRALAATRPQRDRD